MVSSGELTLSFDARIMSEYSEVVKRPKFGFDEDNIAALLEYIEFRGQPIAPSPLTNSLPDSDDEPFLEVALANHAVCIVTKNQIHFPSKSCQGVEVMSPGEFLTQYKKKKAKGPHNK